VVELFEGDYAVVVELAGGANRSPAGMSPTSAPASELDMGAFEPQ
jgi:hypothetical protein